MDGLRVHFSNRMTGQEREVDAWLHWEVNGDPMSDDYLVEEASAQELWEKWLKRYGTSEKAEIYWSIRGDNLGEACPFGRNALHANFLNYFTTPMTTDGHVAWLLLPVADKAWNETQADKGGFIQEATGWKPSPLQTTMDVDIIRAALADVG